MIDTCRDIKNWVFSRALRINHMHRYPECWLWTEPDPSPHLLTLNEATEIQAVWVLHNLLSPLHLPCAQLPSPPEVKERPIWLTICLYWVRNFLVVKRQAYTATQILLFPWSAAPWTYSKNCIVVIDNKLKVYSHKYLRIQTLDLDLDMRAGTERRQNREYTRKQNRKIESLTLDHLCMSPQHNK